MASIPRTIEAAVSYRLYLRWTRDKKESTPGVLSFTAKPMIAQPSIVLTSVLFECTTARLLLM